MRSALPALLLLLGCASPAPGPGPAAAKPAAIETSGVPEVPAALAERLHRYQELRGAAFVDWAPDGKSLLVSARAGNLAQIHRVPAPLAPLEQVSDEREPVAGGRYLPDGSILFSMARGGDENAQLFRLDPRTRAATMVSDGKGRVVAGPLSRRSDRLVAGINAPGARETDLFLLDPAGRAAPERILETKGASWHAADWSFDDSKLLLERYVSANESYLHVMDVATRTLTAIPVPGGVKARHSAVAFAGDGRSIYCASDATGEFAVLARVDLATMQYEWLTADLPWDVTSIDVSPDGRRVAFEINEDGASRLFVIEDGKRRALDLPLGLVGGYEWSPDSTRLALTLMRADRPAEVHVLEGGALVRWTAAELAGFDPATFVRPERISWKSFDGLAIPGYLYRPKRPGRVPVVVSLHGGPEGQFQPSFGGITQFLCEELGVAVIGPNVRGSTGYGKTFTALDNAEKREDSVKDVGALLDWIAARPDLDASRVAVMGGSYGGYLVLACLVHYPERIRAGVDVVGIANFRTFLKNTSAYRQDLRRVEYGDERDPAMQAVFDRISPANRADRIRSALLVVHGKNDPRVPYSEAVQIADKVRANGGRVWTVYAANEGHGFARKENRDYLNGVSALFLQEFLRN